MDSNGNPYYALLSAGGQKLLSILTQKSELPPYVDSKINEELNCWAEEEDFLTEIRLAVVDLSSEQEDLGDDDNSGSINNTRNPHPEQLIIAPPYQALSPAGQKLLAILTQKSELLPTHVESRINEKLNAMADEFLTEIRRAVVDLLFEEDFGEDDNEEMLYQRRKQQQQKNTFIKTIVDTKEWCAIEKQYEKAIRFFPDTLREMRHGLYPIQYISYTFSKEDENGDCTPSVYNLHLVSLIPLLAKLGIELQQFDDDMRGGLLMADPDRAGAVPLQNTISYWRNINANTQLLDDCFFSVLEKLRAQDLFQKKDLRQFHLIEREFFSGYNWRNNLSSGAFTVRNFRYLVEWDPTVLAVPIERDLGDWLPVHFCANNVNRTMEELSVVLQLGLQYCPEKFGDFFTERYQFLPPSNYGRPADNNDDNDDNEEEVEDEIPLPDTDNDDDSDNEGEIEVEVPVPNGDNNDDSDDEEEFECVKGTPFEFACKVHGQPQVLEMVLKCVANYCGTSSPVTNTTAITGNLNADSSSGTTTAHDTESSLLFSAATEASIHLDVLYILLRKDPVDTLLKLHHHVVSSLPHYHPERS